MPLPLNNIDELHSLKVAYDLSILEILKYQSIRIWRPDGLSWIGLLRVTKAWRLMDSFLTPEKMKFGTFSESLTLRFWQQQTCDLTCCNHWINCVWFTIRTIWLAIWFIMNWVMSHEWWLRMNHDELWLISLLLLYGLHFSKVWTYWRRLFASRPLYSEKQRLCLCPLLCILDLIFSGWVSGWQRMIKVDCWGSATMSLEQILVSCLEVDSACKPCEDKRDAEMCVQVQKLEQVEDAMKWLKNAENNLGHDSWWILASSRSCRILSPLFLFSRCPVPQDMDGQMFQGSKLRVNFAQVLKKSPICVGGLILFDSLTLFHCQKITICAYFAFFGICLHVFKFDIFCWDTL